MSEVSRNPSLEGSMLASAQKGEDTGMAYVITRNVIRVLSVFGVVFLRSRLGERYLTSFHVVGSLLLAGVVLVGAYASAGNGDHAALALFLLYVAVLIGRYGGILRRRWRDDFTVHSRSDGNPWPVYRWLRVPFSLIGQLCEPLLILTVGAAVSSTTESGGIGLFFLFGALGHAIEQQLIAQAMRDKLLDVADARHEQREYEAMATRIASGERYAPAANRSPFLARLPSSLEGQRRLAKSLGIQHPPALAPVQTESIGDIES
jgi:hypothetical protein